MPNDKQRKILIAIACVIGLMLMWPPAIRGISGQGFMWIFSVNDGNKINVEQLFIQWLGVLIIGAISLFLSHDHK